MAKPTTKELLLVSIAREPKSRADLLETIKGLTPRALGQAARSLVNSRQAKWRWRNGIEILERARPGASPPPEPDPLETDEPPAAEFAVWNDGSIFIKRDEDQFTLRPVEVQELAEFLLRTRTVAVQPIAPPSAPLLTEADGAHITRRE